jgi:hypothetical protein
MYAFLKGNIYGSFPKTLSFKIYAHSNLCESECNPDSSVLSRLLAF